MAQTKTRSRSRSQSAGGGKRTGGGSTRRARSSSKSTTGKPKAQKSQRRSSGGNSRKSTSRKPTRKQQSSPRSRSAQDGQGESTVKTIAEKAKGPALATGAAIVGVAGGLALKNGRKRHGLMSRVPTPALKVPKMKPSNMKVPKLGRMRIDPDEALSAIGKAAGEISQRSHRFGDVAAGVQKASEAISNGKH